MATLLTQATIADIPVVVRSQHLVNLFDCDQSGLAAHLTSLGEKPFRAAQILRWIHREQVTSFENMSNLSKSLRAKLAEHFVCALPEIETQHHSEDGTIKWILRLDAGNQIETVYIPETNRGTLCVSSQVGCILDCSFCSTGKQGFNRNLKVSEIIGQLWIANQALKSLYPDRKQPITNVVMMGMGEPLLNEKAVIIAMRLMLDDQFYGLSKYRVTLSTSGIVPAMERLKQAAPVSLAVSLHAPDNELRNELVPINKKYPIEQLLACCQHYFSHSPKRAVVFEYVMLRGINDSLDHARHLVQRLRKIHCKVNLIPFNPFPNSPYQSSSYETILAFQDLLIRSNLRTTIRKTRGDDIIAACGQLAGNVDDKTQRGSTVDR